MLDILTTDVPKSLDITHGYRSRSRMTLASHAVLQSAYEPVQAENPEPENEREYYAELHRVLPKSVRVVLVREFPAHDGAHEPRKEQ